MGYNKNLNAISIYSKSIKQLMHKLLLLLFIIFTVNGFSQSANIDTNYLNAYDTLKNMLSNKNSASLKYAVFTTENVFLENKLIYSNFNEHISKLATLVSYEIQFNPLKGYRYSDSSNVQKNYALFKFFKDTLKVLSSSEGNFVHLPYTYDFNDFFGEQNWSNMFVTKLLVSHSGNCHSLPYLYKILADELGATCWLSLAPNHMYIKNRCKGIGWYNTELTSGDFPIDAWIMASGYLPLQAIQNGIYMDTLSNQQCIALCVLDLAKEYEHQTHNYFDSFIIKCCDLSLQYFPKNVQAKLLRAETLKQVFLKEQRDQFPKPTITFNDMQDMYANLYDLGYREMPDKMYMKWLQSVVKERNKYNNPKLTATLQKK